jgi:hemerythrin
MPPIPWDARLETGDLVVDQQHRAIHSLFNELESGVDSQANVVRGLDFLTEHVLVHFATEEDLMARENYPAGLAASHVEQHRQLTEQVRDRVLAYREGRLVDSALIVEFLREWLTKHVHECDQQLVDFVRRRGAAAQLTPAWIEAERRASAS